ncbi:ArsC family reductase [Neorhizobium sp. NPDC001467]|uniref:ArsC family reductase n=1 Tax=Neorhizobium sp. NPDC001467 TaxID=3390595 RepID=UPI003D035EBE
MSVTIFGIKNCDTMKKARTWLDQNGIDHTFHDYKASGIDLAHLEVWTDKAGWETLLNRAGTTFRKLPDEAKADLDRDKAIGLMLEHPSMIKRPVLEKDGTVVVGFKPDVYARSFGKGDE